MQSVVELTDATGTASYALVDGSPFVGGACVVVARFVFDGTLGVHDWDFALTTREDRTPLAKQVTRFVWTHMLFDARGDERRALAWRLQNWMHRGMR